MTAFAALLVALAQQASKPEYVSERYGFRVELPSDEWISYLTDEPKQCEFQVTLYPRGSGAIPSFVVYVATSRADHGAVALREDAVKLLESRGSHDLERGIATVAGSESPWVRGSMDASGIPVVLQCYYVVEDDFTYALQCGWRVGDEHASEQLAAMVKSFETRAPVVSTQDEEQAKLRALAHRCWEALDWCETWSRASERAAKEHKLVLAVYENGAALGIPRVQHTGSMLDPDLRALVQERFVPLKLDTETEAPFREPTAFGISQWAWGTDFLFVTPDGAVLRETSVSNASVLFDIACEVLARSESDEAIEGHDLDAAERALRRGELSDAERRLRDQKSPRAHRLRATLLRMRREGEEALDELRAARPGADAELETQLDADEAIVLMHLGRYAEANTLFERVAKDEKSPRFAEALFWLGAFETLRDGVENEAASWRRLVDKRPGDVWAWKAAANLLGDGAFVHGHERLEWPAPEIVATATAPARAKLKREHAPTAIKSAVDYLVAAQRADATWTVPIEGFSLGSDLYTTGVTALCATSLIPHAREAKTRKAVERALEYVLERHESGALAEGEGLTATYAIWRKTFALLLVARCLEAKLGDTNELRAAMSELATQVVAGQHTGGGWPYVFFPDDPRGEHADPSASFLSAGVVLVLLEARDAGAKVPRECLDRAFYFLAKLRASDGTFGYMPQLEGHGGDSHPEAGGRGPICALALKRGGRADVAMVRETLDLFLRHRGGFVSEWHKELCHTGPQGQGAHYLFYDYYFASAALRELPKKERARYGDVLADDVLAARFADGSFEDLPSLGRPYATAMALMSLAELARD